MKVRNADLARGTGIESDAMANEGLVIGKMNHRNIVRSLGELRAPLTDVMISLLPSTTDKVNAPSQIATRRTTQTHSLYVRPHTFARTGLLLGPIIDDEHASTTQGADAGVP